MTVKENPKLPDGFRKGTRPKVEKLIAELQHLPPKMKVSVTNYNDRYLAAQFDFE